MQKNLDFITFIKQQQTFSSIHLFFCKFCKNIKNYQTFEIITQFTSAPSLSFTLFPSHHVQKTKTKKQSDPELDDEPDDYVPNTIGSHPGVDDGFFSTNPTTPNPPTTTSDSDGTRNDSDDRSIEKHVPSSNGNGPTPGGPQSFPFAPGYNPNVVKLTELFHSLFQKLICFFFLFLKM